MNEIDLNDIIDFLWSRIILICASSFLFACLASVVALNLKEIYTSEAMLQISEGSFGGQSSLSSSAQGLASLAGINLNSGSQGKDRSPDYVEAKIRSRVFFDHLLTFPNVRQGIYAGESFDPNTTEIIYDSGVFNSSTKEWFTNNTKRKGEFPSNQETHRLFLAQLSTTTDKKTGFIYLTYEHSSPFFAKDLVELIVDELNNLQRSQDLNQYEKEMEYLLKQKSSNKLLFLEQSISSLLMNLLQEQTLANSKDQYLVEYIDTPYAPESRSWPLRTRLVLISTFIFSIILVFSLLFRRFVLEKNTK